MDFSGGLNTTRGEHMIEDNEVTFIQNLDPASIGKTVPSNIFASDTNATYGYEDQTNAGTEPTAGYGLFVFENDYPLKIQTLTGCSYNDDPTITHGTATVVAGSRVYGTGIPAGATVATVSDTEHFELSVSTVGGSLASKSLTIEAPYGDEFIAKTDGTDLDIMEVGTATPWIEDVIDTYGADAALPTTPAFYAAEGDLYISGDFTTTPRSLVHHVHNKFSSTANGVAHYTASRWLSGTQARVAPTNNTDMRVSYQDGSHSDVITELTGHDKPYLNWLIRFEETGVPEGLWDNVHDSGSSTDQHWEFGGSWLYKGGELGQEAESEITELAGSSSGADLAMENMETNSFTVASLQLHAFIYAAQDADSDGVYGARIYTRKSTTTEWYHLGTVSFEKGLSLSGKGEWVDWGNAASSFDHAAGAAQVTSDWIPNPPSLVTFKDLNQYENGDRVDKVYFKTGIVANGRAYIANVRMNNRDYPDRIFRSVTFEYDTFIESDWVEVAPNDGDVVTALAAYGDRILEFKNNAVYIINVSKDFEILEDKQEGAGVSRQAAVTTTPFGVIWINPNGCFLYKGEGVTPLHLGKLGDRAWGDSMESDAQIGYDTEKQQVYCMFSAGSSAAGYIFSLGSGGWHYTTDLIATTKNCTNIVNARGNNAGNSPYGRGGRMIMGGGSANGKINFLQPRADSSTLSVNIYTKALNLGNSESLKNLLRVAVVYKYGHASLVVAIRTDDGDTLTTTTLTGALSVDDASPTSGNTKEFDTSAVAALQGKKTFQVLITGTANENTEILSVSLVYRDIGIH